MQEVIPMPSKQPNAAVTTASVLFALIALLHLLRSIAAWPAAINNITIPVPVSYVAFLAAGAMAVWLWKSGR